MKRKDAGAFVVVLTLGALIACGAWADSFSSLEGYPYDFEGQLGLSYADPGNAVQTDPLSPRVTSIIYPTIGFPQHRRAR